MAQSSPAVLGPVQSSVRPRAWADDKVLAGQVGNCASDAAKTYWQRSNQFDRMMADKLEHPLYDQAALDAAVAAERERCAAWVEARRDAFCEEHGSIDPDTGAIEFGRGQHAEAKSEYVGELEEIAAGLRALKA